MILPSSQIADNRRQVNGTRRVIIHHKTRGAHQAVAVEALSKNGMSKIYEKVAEKMTQMKCVKNT